MESYPRLFQPLDLNGRVARNRIVSTSHATSYDDHGLITERLVDYEARKAAGGAGIVSVFGSASVDPNSVASFGSVAVWNEANEAPLEVLAKRVHDHDALIFCQLTHMGRRGNTAKGGRLSAPSEVFEPMHREIPHVLTTGEVERVIEYFGSAAARLERCGFDGIELQGGGQLIEQFFSPVTNQRTDRFGGDLEDRARFALEVVEAISASVEPDFIVGIKVDGDPSTTDFGLDSEQTRTLARMLDATGRLNFVDVGGSPAGTHDSTARSIPSAYQPLGVNLDLAAAMRKAVNAPVLVAGRIVDPAQAEQALADGTCDLVGMTRAMIADPDLPDRARSGQMADVRPCIGINEGCIGRLYQGLEVRCVVNPAIAHPELASVGTADTTRSVLVVGGGPAGMEAARTAAMRGHRTALVERHPELGGQLADAGVPTDGPRYAEYVRWISGQLGRLGVEVTCGTEADAGFLAEHRPDQVIVAVGADDVVPEAVRNGATPCATDVDLYRGHATPTPGSRVVVYDVEGHRRGTDVATWLVQAGAGSVTLATDFLHVAEQLEATQVGPAYQRLAAAGIHLEPNMCLQPDGRGLRRRWSDEPLTFDDYDLVVMVGFRSARRELVELLCERDYAVDIVGDAYAPRRMADAVLEGVRAGAAV